jgi:hypothetical protein
MFFWGEGSSPYQPQAKAVDNRAPISLSFFSYHSLSLSSDQIPSYALVGFFPQPRRPLLHFAARMRSRCGPVARRCLSGLDSPHRQLTPPTRRRHHRPLSPQRLLPPASPPHDGVIRHLPSLPPGRFSLPLPAAQTRRHRHPQVLQSARYDFRSPSLLSLIRC